jgi:alpha-galactosidase
MLFPPEVMGAHIGPERAHTTHRRHDLGFRAATALFGHLGIEWNLLNANAAEREQLASTVEHYKRLRPLLHGGRVERADHPDPAALVHGVVSDDRSHAVFAYVQLTPSATTAPAPMRFPGLDPERRYRVSLIDNIGSTRPFGRAQPSWITERPTMSGRQLVTSGLQMPIQHPESIVLVELGAVS